MNRKLFLMNWKPLRLTFRISLNHLWLTFRISWKSLRFTIIDSRKYYSFFRLSLWYFLNFLYFLYFNVLIWLMKLRIQTSLIFCWYLFLKINIFQFFWQYLNLFCFFFQFCTRFKYQKAHLAKSFGELILFQSFFC